MWDKINNANNQIWVDVFHNSNTILIVSTWKFPVWGQVVDNILANYNKIAYSHKDLIGLRGYIVTQHAWSITSIY